MKKSFKILSAIGLFVSVAIAAIWFVVQVPVPIVERLMEADIRKQAELWHRRVILHLTDPAETFKNGTLTSTDIEYLQLLPEASDVYRFKMYTLEGEVFWSTRIEDIGADEEGHFPANLIAEGEVVYHREQVPAAEIDGLALHALNESVTDHEVAEVFEPVVDSGRAVGAIEFYTDITEVRSSFILRVRVLLSVLTGLALLTMGVVSVIVYRANRNQYQALEQRSNSEKELMTEQLRLARDVKLLGELNEWLQSSRSLDELFGMVARFMTHILPNAEGSVYVYSNSRDVLDGCASWNGGGH
jgi:hypothetical protein